MAKTISYKKLWKLLIDRNMTKTDLRDKSGISTASLAKLGKDENITSAVLIKICNALNCDTADIMEMVDVSEENKDMCKVNESPFTDSQFDIIVI